MKLAKFFVGLFAVAAAMLTTSCLQSDEYVAGPETSVTPTSASATVSKEALEDNGGKINTPTATESGVSAKVQLSDADIAALSDDADVTLFVSENEEAGVVTVQLLSSDPSATLSAAGATVQLSGLEPGATYKLEDGTPVTVDANGNATVVVKSYGAPVRLTKLEPSHSGGGGSN